MIRITIEQGRDRFQVFAAVALVLLYQTGLAEYAFLYGKMPISSSYWLYLIYAMVAVFVGFHGDVLVRATKNPVFWWALAYLVISLLWTLGTSESEDVLKALLWRLHTVAFLMAGLVIFQSPRATTAARWAIVFGSLLGASLNIWDAMHPLWFSAVDGRSAGLYVNPNRSAIALVCGMVIGVGVLPQRWRGLFYLAVSVGVALTFSRSALLALPLVGIGLVALGEMKGRNIAATLAGAALVIGMYFWISGQSPDILMRSKIWNDNTMARARLNTDDVSTRERLKVAGIALRMFTESPVVGYGFGTSLLWEYGESSHNVYLNLMVDHGLFGAALVPLLCWLVYRRNKSALLLVLTVAYFGFYSHNILEDRFVLLPILIQAVLTQRYLESREAAAIWDAVCRRLAMARVPARYIVHQPSDVIQ